MGLSLAKLGEGWRRLTSIRDLMTWRKRSFCDEKIHLINERHIQAFMKSWLCW